MNDKVNPLARLGQDKAAAAQDGQAGAATTTNDSTNGNDTIVGDGVNNLNTQHTPESEAAALQAVVDANNDAGAAPRVALNLETVTGEPEVGLIGARANVGDADTVIISGDALTESLDAELESLDASLIDDSNVLFSSHPVTRLQLGPYNFENAQLSLPREDVGDFEALLEDQPAYIRNMVRKIDVDAANEIIRGRIASMRAGIDTTANTLTPGSTDGKA